MRRKPGQSKAGVDGEARGRKTPVSAKRRNVGGNSDLDERRAKKSGSRSRRSVEESVEDMDRGTVTKQFAETVKSIQRLAEQEEVPHIYNPLVSCFDIMIPYELEDLQVQDETVHVPMLDLAEKTESELESEDCKSKSQSNKRGGQRKQLTSDFEDTPRETSFEYRFPEEENNPSSEESHQESNVATFPLRRNDDESSTGNESYVRESQKLTDAQIRQELRSADRKSILTVKIIEQIRRAIVEYQMKDMMTDEENRDLKKKQQKLTKSLQQLENITNRVKHLVGCADQLFQEEWEGFLGDQLEVLATEDSKAGGDAQQLSERKCSSRQLEGERLDEEKWSSRHLGGERLDEGKSCVGQQEEYKELSPRMKLKDLDRMSDTSCKAESVTNLASNQDNEVSPERKEVETVVAQEKELSPRSRLLNDLDKMSDESVSTESEADGSNEASPGRKQGEDEYIIGPVEPQDWQDKEPGKLSEHLSPAPQRKQPATNSTADALLSSPVDIQSCTSHLVEDNFNESQSVKDLIVLKEHKAAVKSAPSTIISIPTVGSMGSIHGKGSDSDNRSVPDVMLSLTGRLSESYSMQEKLAAENADLEGMRYQLQEELITKENSVELLQRKVENLQAEMRLILRENAQLNDVLIDAGITPSVLAPGYDGSKTARTSQPFEEDAQTQTEATEAPSRLVDQTVRELENEIKYLQIELSEVQRNRGELELLKQRIQFNKRKSKVCNKVETNSELWEHYQLLQTDFETKLLEVSALKAQNQALLETNEKVKEDNAKLEENRGRLEKEAKMLKDERIKWEDIKDRWEEQEQEIATLKLKLRDAVEETEEVKSQADEMVEQMEDYRSKYLMAQQQVEEQIRQIEWLNMEKQRIREEAQAECLKIKQTYQDKLSELTPLPEMLQDTQLRLQEATQLRMIAERTVEDLQHELSEAKERGNSLMRRIEVERSSKQLGLDERSQMMAKLESWEKKCNEVREENARLKTTVARIEEVTLQNDKRLEEKTQEVTHLSSQVEMLKDEAARQANRQKEKAEQTKRSSQSQVAELERQLIQARASARAAHKDKDECQQRLQSHINVLNTNFEEAQMRIKSLQSHVNLLKVSYTGMFTAEPGTSTISLLETPSFANESTHCDCPLLQT